MFPRCPTGTVLLVLTGGLALGSVPCFAIGGAFGGDANSTTSPRPLATAQAPTAQAPTAQAPTAQEERPKAQPPETNPPKPSPPNPPTPKTQRKRGRGKGVIDPDQVANPSARARSIFERARTAYENGNWHKAITRIENADKLVARVPDDRELAEIARDARWMYLDARYRNNRELDLDAEFRALLEARPKHFEATTIRGVAADLALASRFDAAAALLKDTAEDHPDDADAFRSLADAFRSIGAAARAYDGPKKAIDANYRRSMARNRPADARGLYEYALRAREMLLWDLALVALRLAREELRTTAPSERDRKLTYLVRFNEVLAWAGIGDGERAVAALESLAADDPERTDWIAFLQVGTTLAEAELHDAARHVLSAGAKRWPDRASVFRAELDGLGGPQSEGGAPPRPSDPNRNG